MKTILYILIIAFAVSANLQAQQLETSMNCQLDEIGVLDFKYEARTHSYVAHSDLYLTEELEEEDEFALFVMLDSDTEKSLLTDIDALQRLRIGDHTATYRIENDGRVILCLNNLKGGTPMSTLGTNHISLQLHVPKHSFAPIEDIQPCPVQSEVVLNR